MKAPSVASIRLVNEERIRKVAADNPDILDCLLARRFGISVGKLRKILGRPGNYSELLDSSEMAKSHYTPRPGGTYDGFSDRLRCISKKNYVQRKLREQENAKRTAWNPDFKPKRRGGQEDP